VIVTDTKVESWAPNGKTGDVDNWLQARDLNQRCRLLERPVEGTKSRVSVPSLSPRSQGTPFASDGWLTITHPSDLGCRPHLMAPALMPLRRVRLVAAKLVKIHPR
jgi:hypothetical protein